MLLFSASNRYNEHRRLKSDSNFIVHSNTIFAALQLMFTFLLIVIITTSEY